MAVVFHLCRGAPGHVGKRRGYLLLNLVRFVAPIEALPNQPTDGIDSELVARVGITKQTSIGKFFSQDDLGVGDCLHFRISLPFEFP